MLPLWKSSDNNKYFYFVNMQYYSYTQFWTFGDVVDSNDRTLSYKPLVEHIKAKKG